MGLKFDNVDDVPTVDVMKKNIQEREAQEDREKREAQAREMLQAVKASNEKIKANLTKEITSEDRGWIDKYMHSDFFKDKDRR